jgi:ribulose-5-phosphate 4-epimerase/fuculose-1-phosphate aldolase
MKNGSSFRDDLPNLVPRLHTGAMSKPAAIKIESRGAQIEALREIGRHFYSRGWSVGTSSNYSVVVGRAPLQLLITASGRDKGRLGAADFTVVDGEGQRVDETSPRPSAETLLHAGLAHRSESKPSCTPILSRRPCSPMFISTAALSTSQATRC